MANLNDLTAGDLMAKEVCFTTETVTVRDAICAMADKGVSCLIVEKQHAKDAYGIITQKDIVMEASEDWEAIKDLKVGELSTKPVISVQEGMGIKHVARLMRLSGIRRVVVFEGEKVVGVLSNTDIFREIIKIAKAAALAA